MYRRPRLIPCLNIIDRTLVKTIGFTKPRYLGDPINAVKIFNGKGVDELCILDIRASSEGRAPDLDYLRDMASEAFMPICYGGGITRLDEIEHIINAGFEKVVINTAFIKNPQLIKDAVKYAGSQSIIVAIDTKKDIFGRVNCYIYDGTEKANTEPVELAKKAEYFGAGEIFINSISNDGRMCGYDIDLVKRISLAVKIPVIACGGAGNIQDFKNVLQDGGAHAAAAGSLYVYYGNKKAVLITAPEEEELIKAGIYLI